MEYDEVMRTSEFKISWGNIPLKTDNTYYNLGYIMPRVLYQVYNHRGDYKPDITQVGMT